MRRRIISHRRIVILAVFISALLVVGVGLDVAARSRRIPDLMKYIPQSAPIYAITGPLQSIWHYGPFHPILLQAKREGVASDNLLSDLDFVLRHLRTNCLLLRTTDDLELHGFDKNRGMSIAAINPTDHDYVISVPIADPARVMAYFRAFSSNFMVIQLLPARTKAVKAIHITSVSLSGLRSCPPYVGTTDVLQPGTAISSLASDGSATFYLASDGTFDGWSANVTCLAEYQDGEVGSCTCSVRQRPCEELSGAQESEPIELDVDGAKYPALRMNTLWFRPVLTFTKERMAIFSLHQYAVEAALSARGNAARFSADDTLLSGLQRLGGIASPDQGFIGGAISIPQFPIAGNMHFSVGLGPARLHARFLLPWQSMQSSILKNLIAESPNAWVFAKPGPSTIAEVKLNDPRFGSYLDYATKYFKDSITPALERLGPFATFLTHLTSLNSVGELRVAFRGVRDGVPGFVLALEGTAADFERVILGQRTALRESRDRRILKAALAEFDAKAYRDASALEDLKPLLAPEAGALWDRYLSFVITKLSADHPEVPSEKITVNFKSPELTAEDFSDVGYDIIYRNRRLRYLAPPFTANDERFLMSGAIENVREWRISPIKENAETNDVRVRVEALKQGKYRMISYFDESRGFLLVGSDIDTLIRHLEDPRGVDQDINLIPPASAKIFLQGNPQWLLNEGLGYPDKDVRRFFDENFRDLERYRSGGMQVEAVPRDNSFMFTVDLRYD
jgi:hypothetical protein